MDIQLPTQSFLLLFCETKTQISIDGGGDKLGVVSTHKKLRWSTQN